MDHDALGVAEFEGERVPVEENQLFLGETLVDAEGRKAELQHSVMLCDILEFVCITGFAQNFAVLLCSVPHYDIAGGLIVIFLCHYFIEDYRSYLFHCYKLVDPPFPRVVFAPFILKKDLQSVKFLLVKF